MLQGYALFFVADAQLGLMGTPVSKARSEIISTTHFAVDGSQNISPVPDSEIGRDLKLFLDMTKPLFQAQMGKMGETLEPFVFRLPKQVGHGRCQLS